MHFELLDELVIIFLLSIVVNLVCNKIKLTATVGFLLTGVLCGPSLLGIVDSQSISDVAELGVAMLLFTIGMSMRLARFNTMLEEAPQPEYWHHFFVGVPAPAAAALSANAPVWVKQSRTVLPFAMRWIAIRLYFWSRKKPVF